MTPSEKREKKIMQTRAESGDPESQYNLGLHLRGGWRDFGRNEIEAVIWFRKAADQGHTAAQFVKRVSQQILTDFRHFFQAGIFDQSGVLRESSRRTCWLTFAPLWRLSGSAILPFFDL